MSAPAFATATPSTRSALPLRRRSDVMSTSGCHCEARVRSADRERTTRRRRQSRARPVSRSSALTPAGRAGETGPQFERTPDSALVETTQPLRSGFALPARERLGSTPDLRPSHGPMAARWVRGWMATRSLACPRMFKAGSMSPPRRSHPGSASAAYGLRRSSVRGGEEEGGLRWLRRCEVSSTTT
jgi:hypothetical protein